MSEGQSSPSELVEPRKRKRSTIACVECRNRRRRCTGNLTESCESCLRDRLQCTRPDVDGRKTRWKKGIDQSEAGSTSGEPKLGASSGQEAEPLPTQSSVLAALPSAAPQSQFGSAQGVWGMTTDPQPGIRNPQDIWGSSPFDMFLPSIPPISPSNMSRSNRLGSSPNDQSSSVKKVVWWRFHGPSAIAPGLKRVTLKVRLDEAKSPSQSIPPLFESNLHASADLVDEGGMPRHDLMLHLLDIFMTHFGCQFPALSRKQLERDLEQRSGSTLLFNCIASTASRFSNHPEIALPHLEPHSYGLVFLKTAKGMLGNVLGVPTRETVIALTLLAGISHGIDSESEEWMSAGMAVRMAIDLGLHLTPPPDSQIADEDRRLDRLTFWSVYFLDVYLSFGVGRETAFRLDSVTQSIPTDADFVIIDDPQARRVFPHAARLAFAYGPLVNVLNSRWRQPADQATEAQRVTEQAVKVYKALPPELQWSAYNLQNFSRSNQGSTFVQMHLWMHTILASGYLIGTDVLRPDRKARYQGSSTPSNTTATRLWQNSARTIGDILMLSDIVNSFAYHALPFSNQPFVVAGCCYIKEADTQQRASGSDYASTTAGIDLAQSNGGGGQTTGSVPEDRAELFRTLLQSVTWNNVNALRQGLARQTRYWAGVAWVAEVLAQRMSGVSMHDIDLKTVTEALDSTVTVSDPRMFGRSVSPRQGNSFTDGAFDIPAALGLQLPFEADWLADTALLQSQGYPVTVEDFTSDWAQSFTRSNR